MARWNEETQAIEFEDSDWESENNPYVKRFNDYRSEADRRNTAYSELQSRVADLTSEDADAQRRAAEALGLQFVDDVDDHEAEGTDLSNAQLSKLEERVARFEAQEAAREEAETQATAAREFEQAMDEYVVGQLKLDPKDPDTAIAIAYAANNLPFMENGLPNVAEALAFIEARDEQRFEGWRKSKRTTAPKRGETATTVKPVEEMTRDERLEWALNKHEMD